MVLFPPPGRPRDVCVATGLVDEDPGEANTRCDVSVPDSATSFIEGAPIRGRSNDRPPLISGVAPPGVRAVYVQGPGATRRLALSAPPRVPGDLRRQRTRPRSYRLQAQAR